MEELILKYLDKHYRIEDSIDNIYQGSTLIPLYMIHIDLINLFCLNSFEAGYILNTWLIQHDLCVQYEYPFDVLNRLVQQAHVEFKLPDNGVYVLWGNSIIKIDYRNKQISFCKRLICNMLRNKYTRDISGQRNTDRCNNEIYSILESWVRYKFYFNDFSIRTFF